MVRQSVRVCNELGLHARAAARLVRLAGKFRSEIRFSTGASRPEADGKSILSLVLLAAAPGTEITVSAHGEDEQEALKALVGLVESRFGEKR